MGIVRGPRIVQDGMIFHIDAGSTRCYTSGSTTCTDLVFQKTLTGASGSPGTGAHTPDTAAFPLYNSSGSGVFEFNGTHGMNVEEDLGSHTEITLSIWFWTNGIGADKYFTDGRNDGGAWFISNEPGKNFTFTNLLEYKFDETYDIDSPDLLFKWFNLTTVSDASTAKFYINGYEVSVHPTYRTDYITQGSINENLGVNYRIGTRYTTAGGWEGMFGPISIYNRVLTDAEILQNFNASRRRFDL